MENIPSKAERSVVRERTLLIPPTSLTSEIPTSEASQAVTVEMLRDLNKLTFKQRLQKALGLMSIRSYYN